MSIPLYLVDAFTAKPFAGNPAAVCLLNEWPSDTWLQNVAAEMKQAETAFVAKEGAGFRLRWLTPKVEVDLCGHATLASAHVLWSEGIWPKGEPIPFYTRSGTLTALPGPNAIELDFPLRPEQPAEPPAALLSALGMTAKYVGKNMYDYLVEADSADTVRRLAPDFAALAKVPVRGIMVTSRSDDSRYDFISRFFAPASGVDEDSATGSAHCCLVDFWEKRLGKANLVAYQASSRGAVIHVRKAGDRAFLGGNAVTVSRGELLAPLE